jgi:hypothetical protein
MYSNCWYIGLSDRISHNVLTSYIIFIILKFRVKTFKSSFTINRHMQVFNISYLYRQLNYSFTIAH